MGFLNHGVQAPNQPRAHAREGQEARPYRLGSNQMLSLEAVTGMPRVVMVRFNLPWYQAAGTMSKVFLFPLVGAKPTQWQGGGGPMQVREGPQGVIIGLLHSEGGSILSVDIHLGLGRHCGSAALPSESTL